MDNKKDSLSFPSSTFFRISDEIKKIDDGNFYVRNRKQKSRNGEIENVLYGYNNTFIEKLSMPFV